MYIASGEIYVDIGRRYRIETSYNDNNLMITHKKGIRLAVMVAMLTVAALALPAELAFAHATPINYLPAELSTLATSPGEISIEFSERIEQSASSMKLFPPQGEVLVLPARVDQNNPRKFEADLGPLTLALPDGTYTLSWQVVSSDDGHYTKGAYSFAVGTSSALAESGGSVEMVHSSSIIEAFTVFLKLIGESMMIGLLVLLALALRLGAFRDLAFRDTVARYSVRFLYLSAFILATGAISYFVLKTMKLAEVQEIPLISALPKYAVTTGGEMTITLIILLVAFLILSRGMIEKLCGGERFLLRHWVAIVFLVLISYTQARLSHAAASHILPVFSVLMNSHRGILPRTLSEREKYR
jgi:methionine-rich copper-binding protein CopC